MKDIRKDRNYGKTRKKMLAATGLPLKRENSVN
jgi:hypothetical protein